MSDSGLGGATHRERIVLTILGLAVASIAGGAAFGLVLVLFGLVSGEAHSLLGLPSMFAVLIIVSAFAGFPFNLLLSWPAHVVLTRLGLRSASAYLVAGAPLGLAVACAILITFNGGDARILISLAGVSLLSAGLLAFSCVAGVVGAWAFWLVRRPDKDMPQGSSSKVTSA